MSKYRCDFNSIENYLQFIKMYYLFTMKSFPKDTFGASRVITEKDRIIALILGYLFILCSPFGLLVPVSKNYIIVLLIIFLGTINLVLCKFSFVFYAHQYYWFLKKDKSFNSKVILEYYFYGKSSVTVFRDYSKKYNIVEVSTSVKKVKFFLVEKKSSNKICIKITHNKIYFNRKCILKGRITQLDVMQDCLYKILNN